MGQTAQRCPKKSYIGWTKVAHLSLDGASTRRDHFHETKMEIVISSSLWIHSQSGWKSVPCPLYTVGGPPSSYMTTWLPVGANRTMSRLTMALSLLGSFARLCKGLGIIHHHITIGNSKANGQVERTIRTLKDCIQRGLTKMPATFWMNHLALALLLLRMTVSRMMRHRAVSASNWLTTVVTKHRHPRTTLPP